MRLSKSFMPLVVGLSVLSTPALTQTVPEHGVFILNSFSFGWRIFGHVHGLRLLYA